MYKTVIFDLDGTLLDTLEDLFVATNQALKSVDMPLRTKEEVRKMIGHGAIKLIERALGENCTPQLLDNAVQSFTKYYKEHCEDFTKPYDDVMKVLKTLKEKGVKVGIVSNKPNYAVQVLANNYFGELVDLAMGEDEKNGVRKKPAPDSVIKSIELLGGNVNSSIYVGDSEVDIHTAKNANIPCLSCTWGFKDKDFLIENGATLLVEKPIDMLDVLVTE